MKVKEEQLKADPVLNSVSRDDVIAEKLRQSDNGCQLCKLILRLG
jgi:hypothetical protein